MGLIGDLNSDIKDTLLWALQFEVDPLIRTEACHSLILLIKSSKEKDLMEILSERFLIEEESVVKK